MSALASVMGLQSVEQEVVQDFLASLSEDLVAIL